MYTLTRQELSILKRLNTPEKIQRYVDEDISYNKEKDGETCRSPRRVLRDSRPAAPDVRLWRPPSR